MIWMNVLSLRHPLANASDHGHVCTSHCSKHPIIKTTLHTVAFALGTPNPTPPSRKAQSGWSSGWNLDKEETSIHNHLEKPSFFLYLGLRHNYGLYPSFQTYGVHPLPLSS